MLPDGTPRNQARYIEMDDGVRIAVDLWFPSGLTKNDKVPTLFQMTRYWRAKDTSFLQRALIGLGLYPKNAIISPAVKAFNQAGYAVLLVDARGSGASFGHRMVEISQREIKDYGRLVDWAAVQSWSNGRVGSYGVSYDGITAERLAGTGRPAVKAVAPLYADFDFQFGIMQPGGATLNFIDLWSDSVMAMDHNDICALADVKGFICLITAFFHPGVKPVDADPEKKLLQKALKDHKKNIPLAKAFENVRFRDDTYGNTKFTIADLNTYSHKTEIEALNIPMQIWLGWFDAATVNGGLSRFATFSNPQDVIIGPFSHGGAHNTNPFRTRGKDTVPSLENQYKHLITFFNQNLKKNTNTTNDHRITYYTAGANRWCQTSVWPPSDIKERQYFLRNNNSLSEEPPTDQEETDTYKVDFSHSTGMQNRWFTNLNYGDVIYDNRDEEDKKLLIYTSEPLGEKLVITGSAILSIHLSSSHPDVVFHIYLEGIAPNGNVYHIAEGILRSVNHPLANAPFPSDIFGPHRSYKRADARPLIPGEITEIQIGLTPISIEVPKGHRLRIALGGADQSIFPRHPQNEVPIWTIHRNATALSHIIVPLEGDKTCKVVKPF